MVYKDGTKYEGWWIEDKKEGMGKMSYANRQVEYGLWKDNKLATGLLVFKDGSYVYKGDWKQKFGATATAIPAPDTQRSQEAQSARQQSSRMVTQ